MKKQPNYLFIFPDQWRGDCLSFLGHPDVETPFLDELCHNGITFTSAYSAAPTCIAARACLATGQTPSTNGRLGYKDGVPWRYKNTLMHCLRDGGYQTLLSGKTHFYPQRATLGFEEMKLYDNLNIERDFKSDYIAWLEKETGGKIKDTSQDICSNSVLAHPWVYDEYLHPNNWTTDTAIDMLERRDPTRPFFMQLGYHRPHPPLDPPISYYNKYNDKKLSKVPVGDWAKDSAMKKVNGDSGVLTPRMLDQTRKAYYAQLEHIDYQIGRVLFFLRKKTWLDDTYIIFCSDHGELLGEHNMFSKKNPFEGSSKIPLVVVPPKNCKCERGVTSDVPVTHMDIMPTLLEESGLTIPKEVEGSSIYNIIRGSKESLREYMHGEHSVGENGWQFVTDGKEKFIWESFYGTEYFFDLTSDKNECKNLINDTSWAKKIDLWRNRLIVELSTRPDDGLSDGKSLISGKRLPSVRPELELKDIDHDGRKRPI